VNDLKHDRRCQELEVSPDFAHFALMKLFFLLFVLPAFLCSVCAMSNGKRIFRSFFATSSACDSTVGELGYYYAEDGGCVLSPGIDSKIKFEKSRKLELCAGQHLKLVDFFICNGIPLTAGYIRYSNTTAGVYNDGGVCNSRFGQTFSIDFGVCKQFGNYWIRYD